MKRAVRLVLGAGLMFLLLSGALAIGSETDKLTVSISRPRSDFETRTGRWEIRILFNRPVNPSDLAQAITMTKDDASVNFEIVKPSTYKPANEPSDAFSLISTQPIPDLAGVKVEIKEGLQDVTKHHTLSRPLFYAFNPFKSAEVDSWTTFYNSKKNKGLEIRLSERIPIHALSKALKIRPEVPGFNLAPHGSKIFRITGEFKYQQEYVLRITETKIPDKRLVLESKEITFSGPGLKPDVSVKTDRSVIELKGKQLLPLTLSNVDKVRCRLNSIPPYFMPEITASWSTHTPSHTQDYTTLMKSLGKIKGLPSVFLKPIEEGTEVFFAPEALDRDLKYSLPLSFRKNADRGGTWKVMLSDPDGSADAEKEKLVQITDLSISYKISPKNLLLWVTSLHTGLPVPGAEILFFGADGVRYVAGKTDKSGVLFLENGKKLPALVQGQEASGLSEKIPDIAELIGAVAALPQDACCIDFKHARLKPVGVNQAQGFRYEEDDDEVSREMQNQQPNNTGSPFTGYLFTERGVYQPGETVHFKCYARSYKNQRIVSPSGTKVKIEITDPKNDVVYSKEPSLGDFGTSADSFQLEKFSPSGTYTITATIEKPKGEDGEVVKPLRVTKTFLVQQYKRPRHFVTLAFSRDERNAKGYVGVKMKEELLNVDVQAQYYTGGGVKHAKVRWKAELVPAIHKVSGYDAYLFGNESEDTLFIESGESLTDGNGKLHLSIPLDQRLLTGIYGVKVSTTVLDIDGEPATGTETHQPKPRFMVGISSHPRQVGEGYASPLKLVVLDQNGKKVSDGKLKTSLLRQSYFYSQKRDDDGNINYLWDKGWMKTATSSLTVTKGEALYDFQLNEYGDYLVTFTYEDKSGNYSSQTLFKVGWDRYDDRDREQRNTDVRTGETIFVGASKKEYRVGESVRISFHTPRPVKKCLITLEQADVLEYRVIDMKGMDGTFEFSAKDAFQPNMYASVIAAAGREGYPIYQSQVDTAVPSLFYGYADITVRTDVQKLRVAIEPGVSELKGRPAEKKTLSFTTTDNKGHGEPAELAVCVVDEAVLALTNFKTPELSSLTNFNLPLAVFSGDLRMALVGQDLFRIFSTKPLTGGGGGFEPIAADVKLRKDFRPVAYFNPSVLTDEAGRAKVEFELPDSTTAYRVYVVACDKGSGFASTQRNMVVTKEFFAEPSPPRFLIPGDKLTFPVSLNNKTAQKGEVSLETSASPNLKFSLSKTSCELQPWAVSPLDAACEVTGHGDQAMIRITGRMKTEAGTYNDAIERTIPLHSRYLPINKAILGGFSNRTEIPVTFPDSLKKAKLDDLSSTDFQAHIGLSTTNWTKLAPGLKYLLRYPFGCVEQTSSGVIPLAGMRGLVAAGVIPGISVDEVDKFLKSGVERLLSMQMTDGGFSYWSGGTESSWWGTMYATFALSNAKRAGYAVPEKNLKSALTYIRDALFKKNDKDPYHGQSWTREYALFNLVMADMLSSADLERFFTEYDSLSSQGKALLLLAAKKTSYLPDDKIREILAKLDPSSDFSKKSYNDSSVRETAVCLMAAVEIDAGGDKANTWAGSLLKGIQSDGKWHSTCDTGWALLALSRYYEGKGKAKDTPQVKVRVHYGEEKPIEATLSDASVFLEIPAHKLLEKGKVTIEADSELLVNYTLSVTYPDLETDPSQLEKGFVLEKKMENLNGKEDIRVGDIVRVTLSFLAPDLESDYESRQLEYVALEDPVPAGLVPISSELATEGMDKKKTGDDDYWRDGYYILKPTFTEFRDDGVRVFKNKTWGSSYRYSYLARAVTPGDFWMRGSRVSLMYEPDRYGKTVGRQVTILPISQ